MIALNSSVTSGLPPKREFERMRAGQLSGITWSSSPTAGRSKANLPKSTCGGFGCAAASGLRFFQSFRVVLLRKGLLGLSSSVFKKESNIGILPSIVFFPPQQKIPLHLRYVWLVLGFCLRRLFAMGYPPDLPGSLASAPDYNMFTEIISTSTHG